MQKDHWNSPLFSWRRYFTLGRLLRAANNHKRRWHNPEKLRMVRAEFNRSYRYLARPVEK